MDYIENQRKIKNKKEMELEQELCYTPRVSERGVAA